MRQRIDRCANAFVVHSANFPAYIAPTTVSKTAESSPLLNFLTLLKEGVSIMGLAPEASPRRFDVLQKRLDELALQKRGVAKRAVVYQDMVSRGPLEQITAIKSQPVQERLQYA